MYNWAVFFNLERLSQNTKKQTTMLALTFFNCFFKMYHLSHIYLTLAFQGFRNSGSNTAQLCFASQLFMPILHSSGLFGTLSGSLSDVMKHRRTRSQHRQLPSVHLAGWPVWTGSSRAILGEISRGSHSYEYQSPKPPTERSSSRWGNVSGF